MPEYAIAIITYLAVVSIVAAGLTLRDKHAAAGGKWRVKERTLLLVSAIGGSVVMYVVMRLIRHKTKHMKFMLGIPLIIIAQAAALFIILRYIA